MQLTDLTIKNFLTITEASVRLSNRGLLLIQGENKEDSSATSNGSGKSSLVDAICWCLFGTTARKVAGDRVVNRKAKKNCTVSIRIEDDSGDVYLIERTRKPNALNVSMSTPSSTAVDLTKGTEKETQEVIESIIGCSADVFMASVYAGQERMPNLPGMTDKELKLLIEEAAGVQTLAEAYAIARNTANNAQSVLSALSMKVAHMQDAAKTLEEQKNEIERMTAEHLTRVTAEVREMVLKARAHIEDKTTLLASLDPNEKTALLQEVASIQASLAGLNGQQARLDMLTESANEANRQLAVAVVQAQSTKSRFESAQKALENVDSRVGKPCGECGKPYEEHDLDTARNHATHALDRARDDRDAAATKLEAAKKAAADAHDAVQSFKATMTNTATEYARLSAANTKLAVISDKEKAIAALDNSARTLAVNAKKKQSEENPFAAHKLAILKKIEENEVKLKEEMDKVAKAEVRANILQEATVVLGPAGVRAHILDTVTPFLNDRTSHYLGTLSDGAISAVWTTLSKTAKGEVREKFSIEVTNNLGGESFDELSGGEKRKVRIACAMALQDLVATRATKPIQLFIADEVDHAIDPAGLERLMAVLEQKARERGTVLVISHNSLADWIDNIITVVKDGQYSSRVEGALS